MLDILSDTLTLKKVRTEKIQKRESGVDFQGLTQTNSSINFQVVVFSRSTHR